MYKKLFFLFVSSFPILFFSCQKDTTRTDLISCQKDVSSSGKAKDGGLVEAPDPSASRNGGGPYILNMLIQLRGENEVPSVTTTALGTAHLRLTADRVLYSKVVVENLDEGDVLRFSHVHSGATGVNGPIRIFLCRTVDDFGKNMVQTLSEENYNLLLNQPCYVNAHSNFHPPGLIRGQVR